MTPFPFIPALDLGADGAFKNKEGISALDMAVIFKNEEAQRLLRKSLEEK